MNERNAFALHTLFTEMIDAWLSEMDGRQYDGPDEGFAAEWLAARGVLMPSALTDEEASTVFEDAVNTDEGELIPSHAPDKLKSGLERIAKGEG